MGKKGVAQISGIVKPIVGETYTYSVTNWYPDTEPEKRNPNNVTWELFKQRSLGKFTTTNIRKKGINSFTFGEKAVGSVYKLQAYLYEPEGGGLIITPQPAKIPKIDKVELFYVDDKKGSTFSFMEKLRARAYCVNMLKKELVFTLWEDDAKGEGHNANNKLIETRKAKVNENGIAVTEFMLTKALMKKAMQGETDPKQLEFYVTVEYYSHKKHATDNVNINNPFPPIKGEVPAKPRGVPKAKGSPAASKPASKKEEKGILENVRDWWKDFDLWDWGESSGTIKKDQSPTVQKPDGRSPAIVKGEKKPTSSCICKEQYKDLIWGGKVSCEFRKKVILISRRNSIDPNNLMAAIAHETGGTFDPTIGTFKKHKNESKEGYVGLLQIGKDAATDLKITRTKLLNMNQIEQLDYVEKYLNLPLVKGKLNTLTDFYLAVLFPVDCGKGNQHNHVVFDNSLPISYKNGKAIRNLNYWRNVGYSANPAFHKEGSKEKGKTYVWEIAEYIKKWYDNGKKNMTKEFSCQKAKVTPKQTETSSKIVYFDSGLTEERVNVVSQSTISILEKAAKNSANDKLIITSTIRSTRKQAEVMYNNESSGNHIRYAAPGRAVIAVFNTGKSRSDSKEKIISDMDKKIKELSESGQRVSLHCVSKEAYSKNNIIDISYSRGAKNPRDLIRELVKDPAVTKIIHPLNNVVSNSKIKYDTKEPAIHVEIKVQ